MAATHESGLTRRGFLLGAGVTVGAVAAGCGPLPFSQPAATPSAGPVRIKLSTVASGATGFLTHVMTQRKINERYNLELDLVSADPAAAERAVLFKQVDAGLFPILSAARANSEGQAVTLFGPLLWNHNYGLTFADRPYTRLADLRGKKIATLDPISSTYQSTLVLAKEQGLDFEKDFKVVTSPPPAVIAFLQRGDVEGIIHFEPNIGNLLTTAKYKVFFEENAEWKRLTGQNMFFVGLAAFDTWLKANGDGARRLVQAVLKTAQTIRADATVFQQYADFLGLDSPAKVKAAQERMTAIYPTEWNQAAADNAESLVKRAIELKILAKAPGRRVTAVL